MHHILIHATVLGTYTTRYKSDYELVVSLDLIFSIFLLRVEENLHCITECHNY
jgi:hypothetical protein